MKNIWLFLFAFSLFFMISCQSVRKAQETEIEEIIEPVQSETAAPDTEENKKPEDAYRYHFLKGYQAAATRQFDLLHTELHVSFDWANREMPGRAILTLTPYFYPQRILSLDAKNFLIQKIARIEAGEEDPLPFEYDSLQLHIDLGRSYEAGEELTLLIEYRARPYHKKSESGRAIRENRGLYFINADGTNPNKPREIWTQGEPESNSNWFPTIDKPNERCTQSMYITVADSFTTLSNGLLIESIKHDNGTRTDHWEMTKPHAPYLFMMAVGPFVVTKDEWRGRPVNYYMEPKYAPNARRIFGRTPEMMEAFSQYLGVDFPWPNYSQVVVRDFVSGAMENTTATVHYSALNATRETLVDRDFDDIIAHELFHQWFGDYVTCESWSNIPLNESFATYGEILWHEHRGGIDEADEQRLNDLGVYLMAGWQQGLPMIRYYYHTPDELFDVNSYQRGGATLAMLRNYVGDKAFFKSLNLYLTRHALQPVEMDQLRLAFEEVTGEDLNWFFDEWFYTRGSLETKMNVRFDKEKGETVLMVSQKNHAERTLPFRLPIDVAKYKNGKKEMQRIWLTGRDSTYRFPGSYDALIPDERNFIVGRNRRSYPSGYIYHMYQPQNSFYIRKWAIDSFKILQVDDPRSYEALKTMTYDPYPVIRMLATEKWEPVEADFPRLRELALGDPNPEVRAAALNKIYAVKDSADYDVFGVAVLDSSIKVAGEALFVLYEIDPETAKPYLEKFEKSDDPNLVTTIAEIYAKEAGPEKQSFFREAMQKDIGWSRFVIINRYAQFLSRMDNDSVILSGVEDLKKIAENENGNLAYISFRALKRIRSALISRSQELISEAERERLKSLIDKVDAAMREIYEKSQNKMIKKIGVD